MNGDADDVILKVEDLSTAFEFRHRTVRALRSVTLVMRRGRTLALVGESGSGKSVTALSVLRLLSPPGRIVGGSVRYLMRDGAVRDLVTVPERDMRRIRGGEIAMIFQEPMSSLNPLMRIGDQIGEMLRLHTPLRGAAARARVLELLELVELPGAARRLEDYPHRMSGGMRQRVMIAMALACGPALLIADEPTTALDVTIQAQILRLMRRLQRELGMSILFVTHDMGVVAEMADDVAVMYAGEIVEQGDVLELFRSPRHHYTRGLLASMPSAARAAGSGGRRRPLVPIPGTVPPLTALPLGCAFAPRCAHAEPTCAEPTVLAPAAPGYLSRCWKLRAAS